MVGIYSADTESRDTAITLRPVSIVFGTANVGVKIGSSGFGCDDPQQLEVIKDGMKEPIPAEDVNKGYGSIDTNASGKNTISVGATGKGEPHSTTPYSSRGPTKDGRLKPEIVAIGGLDDPLPEEKLKMPDFPEPYGTNIGTSLAAPQVTGALALLVEHYRILESDPGLAPAPALLKAVVLNAASRPSSGTPHYGRGYGFLDIASAVDSAEQYEIVTLGSGSPTTSVAIDSIPATTCELRVMAVWTDPPAMMGMLLELVNDIDITVVSAGQEFMPWVLDPVQPSNNATRGENHVDNVEQVSVPDPAGSVTVSVGGQVNMGPQEVVIHWRFVEDCNVGETDTATTTGDGGGGGCACSGAPRPMSGAELLLFGVLLAGRRRRSTRSRSADRRPRGEA